MSIPYNLKTRRVWENRAFGQAGQNASLILDKFAHDVSPDIIEAKQDTWDDVIAAKPSDGLHKAHLKRLKQVVANAHGRCFSMQTEWRLVAGLGQKGPLELGFAFDRYGLPVLHGSGLKGLARAAARSELGADAEQNATFLQVFGTETTADPAASGNVIFFDAVPLADYALSVDIMTPQFFNYYNSGQSFAKDSDKVTPISFLSLTPNTDFLFAVGSRDSSADNALVTQAQSWLVAGLTTLGAGAKTSTGYGYFTLPAKEISLTIETTDTESVTGNLTSQPQTTYQGKGKIKHNNGRLHKLKDENTGILHTFSIDAYLDKGKQPRNKAIVNFLLEDGNIVKVWQ